MIKELEKIKNRNDKEFQTEQGIGEIKLLLEENGKQEIDALKTLGMAKSLQHIENKKSKFLERENFEKEYGKVFREEEIRELCINYNLRFLRSEKYNGPIDMEIGSKIVKFCEKSNISLKNGAYGHSFYIVAPRDYFDLEKRQGDSFSQRMRRLLSSDPLLFYKIKGDEYALVHQWGNTFTYMRYIRAFFNRSWKNSFLGVFAVLFAALTFMLSWSGASLGAYIGFGILTLACQACFYGCAMSRTEVFGKRRLYFSDTTWDSDKRA